MLHSFPFPPSFFLALYNINLHRVPVDCFQVTSDTFIRKERRVVVKSYRWIQLAEMKQFRETSSKHSFFSLGLSSTERKESNMEGVYFYLCSKIAL